MQDFNDAVLASGCVLKFPLDETSFYFEAWILCLFCQATTRGRIAQSPCLWMYCLTKHECAGTLCLYEWGLHVLVRGHVRHVGWELCLWEKKWIGRRKQLWMARISPVAPLTIRRHTCFIKWIPDFANNNRPTYILYATVHRVQTGGKKKTGLQHKRYRSQLRQGAIFRSGEKKREGGEREKEKKSTSGFCNLIWSPFLRKKKIPSMVISIQSDSIWLLAKKKRSRAENSRVLWLILASSLSSPGSSWINLILFLKVSVSKGDLMTHWRQCRSIAHAAGTGRATPSPGWSLSKQPQLCKYPSFAGDSGSQGFVNIETPNIFPEPLQNWCIFSLLKEKLNRSSRTAVLKKNHTFQRNHMGFGQRAHTFTLRKQRISLGCVYK